MLKRILIIILGFVPLILQAQKTYSTRSAKVKFFSHTVAEDIEAINHQVICTLNDKTGQIDFAVLIKGFKFENTLMEQHFNEKDYMYSSKYPKASFKGTITNISSINFAKNGTYNVTADGLLNLHGISQKISAKGSVTILNGKVSLKSSFIIQPKKYGINVPDIADDIRVSVNSNF